MRGPSKRQVCGEIRLAAWRGFPLFPFSNLAIIKAAELAGGEKGLTGYLQTQANANPSAFLSLLGKVLPLQMAGDKDNPLQHVHVLEVKRIIVRQ